jgi:hypothetical protein
MKDDSLALNQWLSRSARCHTVRPRSSERLSGHLRTVRDRAFWVNCQYADQNFDDEYFGHVDVSSSPTCKMPDGSGRIGRALGTRRRGNADQRRAT